MGNGTIQTRLMRQRSRKEGKDMEKNTLLYSKTKMETGIPSRKLIVFDGEAPPREVDLDQTGKKK